MREIESIERELAAARRRVDELETELQHASSPLMQAVYPMLVTVDPNWSSVHMNEGEGGELYAVWLNGPAHGDVPLTEFVKKHVPDRDLIDELELGHVCYTNPAHQLEFIPGRTMLTADNEDHLWVIDVAEARITIKGEFRTSETTAEEVKRSLERDGNVESSGFEDVQYAPFRFGDSVYKDIIFTSAEQLRRVQSVWDEWPRTSDNTRKLNPQGCLRAMREAAADPAE